MTDIRDYSYSPDRAELWSSHCFEMVSAAFEAGKMNEAREVAVEWADGVCADNGILRKSAWKEFKRELVAKWFGAPEKKHSIQNGK